MAEGIDLVSALITRYAVVESLYLLEDSSLKGQLTDSITKLYTAILRYLGIANAYYNKSTARRVGESAFKSARTLVEEPIAEVRSGHEGRIWGNYPLEAAEVGLEDLCRSLIARGIGSGTQPITSDGRTPLHCATESNKAGVIELLLTQPEVDKNARSHRGYTPLWWSVKGENAKSVMTLLAHDVHVDISDYRGSSPLIVAVQKNNQDIARMLLAAGAKTQLNEALEVALAEREEEMVQLLKDFGAVELDEGFGLEGLMGKSPYQIATDEEMQAMAGAENVDE
ncbi:hypothetical protein E4T48_08189 [Aureobasidium sp. EXF-10727]|nr:hypothetical protein E4T48_08189 [Aureobasidium sp. EXF-10727]